MSSNALYRIDRLTPIRWKLSKSRHQAQRFAPKVEILPTAQRRLWDELKHTPKDFVLYGGTALALTLAHRTSEDLDFFSNHSFAPDSL
ncbi:MAG: nucleotidyl transferase AbiEii/AbiGii toxin family protein [Acidobacteriota bacterium]